MEEKLWKILEEGTMGWELADPDAVKLTKEQAKARLEFYMNEGRNPNRLRAVHDNA